MPRLKLQLAYTGYNFSGWQFQPNQRTVQGVLEEALGKICQARIRVHGAGRTDAGVHAVGQVAHCDLPASKSELPWQKALNAVLPWDVAVTEAAWSAADFHARFQARAKQYSYTLWTEPDYVLPQRRPFVWAVGRLDVQIMRQAAATLQGRHDFKAMQNKGGWVQNTVRELQSIDCAPGVQPQELVFFFVADGFLKQMVRNLISCLLAVGQHKMDLAGLKAVLDCRDRTQAPATAPARGLCLEKIWY